MLAEAKIKNGSFVDKENLLDDVSKVYKEGFYSDITIALADNVSISTNRFLLACRIPYFATMLFGGYAENSSTPVHLECCNSEIFKRILDFVWEGEILFTDMNILSLLDLLESSRFLCIDLLVDGIVAYLKYLLESKQVEHKDCLVALDFSILHKFTTVSNFLLSFIDQNLCIISSLPEFNNLSDCSMKTLLNMNYRGRISSDIVMFRAFVKWLENKDALPANIKREMLICFELERFSNTDLVNTVRRSNLFDDKEMCDVLEKRLGEVGEVLDTNKVQMEAQEEEIEELENQTKEQENRIEEQKKKVRESEVALRINKELVTTFKTQIKTQTNQIQEHGPVSLVLILQEMKSLGSTYRTKWKMDHERFINKIEFNLDYQGSTYCFSYYLKSSLDGVNWNEIINCKDTVYTGKQIVHFERQKMKFLDIVTGSNHAEVSRRRSVRYVFAIML